MLLSGLLRSPFGWLALLYIPSAKGHLEIIDTEYSVRTAIAIIEDGSMLIDPVDPIVREIAPEIEGTDKIYSQYGLGLVTIFLPIVLLGKGVAWLASIDQRVTIDFLLSFYNLPFALLGLWFFRSILIKLGASPAHANFFMLILGICTAYWKYTASDYSEIAQSSFLLGALHAVIGKSRRRWRLASFWCGLLVAMKLAFVVLLPIFALFAWLEKPDDPIKTRIQNLLNFSIFLIPMGLALAAANYLRFGNILETGYGSQGSSFSYLYFQRDWFDYLFSTQRGIIPFNPILLMTLPAYFAIPKDHRRFFLLIISLCTCWYVLMCFWKSLQGGWCWGNRLLFPILPLLMIPFAFLNLGRKRTRVGLWLLVPLSILMLQLPAVSTKTHEYSVLAQKINDGTAQDVPPQLPGTLFLFFAKLSRSEPIYLASEIGIRSEMKISLLEFDSFYGFNFWPVHLMNFLGIQSGIAWAGNLILAVLTFLTGFILFRFYPRNAP